MANNASSPEGESSTGGSFKRAAVGEEVAGGSSRESPHQKRARGGSPNSSKRDGSSDGKASAIAEPAPHEQGLPEGAAGPDSVGTGEPAASEPEVFLIYEEGEVAEELKSKRIRARIDPRVTNLSVCAFHGCKKLVEVQLNEGLEGIGDSAFEECRELRIVAIPSTVTELGDDAFAGCSNLTEVHLNEGLQIIGMYAFERCTALRNITLPSTVTELREDAFCGCSNLAELHFNEGLQTIGDGVFKDCTALRSVSLPSTITKLGLISFYGCSNLAKVQLNEGLQVIATCAFRNCTSLQNVTLPSTITNLGENSFLGCINLSEVILLGGGMLLNQDFFARGFSGEEPGLLNQRAIEEILFDEVDERRDFAFHDCPLTEVRISISCAVSERMARLTPECRVSVEERILNLPRLELMQDGNVLACFPLVSREPDDDAADEFDTEEDSDADIQDTNNETARSVDQVLQWIAFHELKESSILIELAMWKSRIDGDQARSDCRVAIPGPAKSLIMEYCGFAGFLGPAIEGA